MFHYRYIYKTVFGTKWQDLDAEDDEAADRIFWGGKIRDLNEIVMVSKSTLPVEEDGRRGADQGDDECLRGRACQLEDRFDDDVLPGGGEVEHLPVRDSLLGPRSHDGDSRPGGNRKRVKDLLSLLLGGKED